MHSPQPMALAASPTLLPLAFSRHFVNQRTNAALSALPLVVLNLAHEPFPLQSVSLSPSPIYK